MKSSSKPTLRTIRICYAVMMLGLLGVILLPSFLPQSISPVIPIAIYCVVTSPLVVYLAINEHRRQREARVGRCPACGYDLRATPERCPECGTTIAEAKTNSHE